MYNHIENASKLGAGCDYSIFKEGIKPMWEDSRNTKGGRWLINLEKKNRNMYLDQCWLEIILCLIGERRFLQLKISNFGQMEKIRPKQDRCCFLRSLTCSKAE